MNVCKLISFKMNVQFTVALILFAFVHKSKCGNLDDEIDEKLSDHTGELVAESRYSFVTSSFYDWIKNIKFISYGSSGYYFTLPDKTSTSILVNGTTSTVFPLAYTLVGAGLIAYVSAYLLNFIPIDGSSSRNDEFGDYPGDPGYGPQRDSDHPFDELYDEDYDYQYPDSLDFNTYQDASEQSEPKLPTRKINEDLQSKKGKSRKVGRKRQKAVDRQGM